MRHKPVLDAQARRRSAQARGSAVERPQFGGWSVLTQGARWAEALTVIGGDGTDDAGGDPGHHGAGRDMGANDSTGCDNRTLADGDAGQDRDIGSEPGAVLDGDDGRELGAGHPQLGIEGVPGRGQGDVGPEEDAVADADLCVVDEGGAGVLNQQWSPMVVWEP